MERTTAAPCLPSTPIPSPALACVLPNVDPATGLYVVPFPAPGTPYVCAPCGARWVVTEICEDHIRVWTRQYPGRAR